MFRRATTRLAEPKADKGKMLIAFGSQTGTAENYARMLGTFAHSHGFTPVVCSLNDAVGQIKAAEDVACISVVCSTYGTGEFPSNSQAFAKALESGELAAKLKGVPYTVLGLGNSHNDQFNAAAKKIAAEFKAAGGKSLVRSVMSCELEATGHDAAFRNWKRSIWAALGADTKATATASYAVSPVLNARCENLVRPHFEAAMVHKNELLTPKDYHPHSRLLTFQMSMRHQKEMLGRRALATDQVLIQPANSSATIARAVKRLGLKADLAVEVAPLASALPSWFDGHKVTVRQLLRDVVDLTAIPSRSLLEVLATLAADPIEEAELEELANDLSAGSKYEVLTAGAFSVLDCLEMFPSLKVDLAQLLSHAPHIAPRTYSIARDNSHWKNDEFEIVYNVPEKTGDNGRTHVGLATSALERVHAGETFMCQFVPGVTAMPKHTAPLAIVALGTGVGFARSVLQARQNAKKHDGVAVAKAVLYYGFRHTGQDQFFTEELAALEAEDLVEVRYVASHDTEKFVTPMDTFDQSLNDFLGPQGEVLYCGLGGSAPLLCETALRKVGVDVVAMRANGRYHEEYFTADADAENLLKEHTGNAGAATLAGRMGNCEMFCFQCEQTFKNKGCNKVGVCGKTPRVAALQDLCVHQTKVLGLYAHKLREMGVADDAAVNRLTLYGLFTTLTNVNFDEERFVALAGDLQKATARVQAAYEKECAAKGEKPLATPSGALPAQLPNADKLVEMGRQVGVLSRFGDASTQSAAGVGEMLMYGLKGVAAYTDHSLMNGKENPEIYAFLHKALAFLISPEQFDLGQGLALCLEAGKTNVTAMSLLYDSNKTLGVPTPKAATIKPVAGKAILISGHDLIILKALLDVTEPLGINVYTHGEMLPAHAYPELAKYKTLAGHYGGAWMRQSVEFPHFPGPVLMTTNCLTEPHESYRDRIFTAGAVGWNGVPHLGNTMADIKFDDIIKAAQDAKGFTAEDKAFAYPDPVGTKRPEQYTVGFGHETVLSVAPTIIEEIQKGNITRFFVVGGCDGYEGERSYYTELVKNLPKTAVVLTLGCGKFRVNHLDMGTIGDTGIPRILDMGQCNDSFSAVQVALALAGVLKCEVKDLPLSIVLSWFEQKAVAVLLSLLSLGIKPIHIGPSLPAFLTPEVATVLVNDFGIVPCGDPKKDSETMNAATGAS